MGKRSYRQGSKRFRRGISAKSDSPFQGLEQRLLFSTINVNDYGAIPNDNLNDLLAIQAAVNASGPGDTILFPGGVYDINNF